jgi:hypothetical protein
MTKRIVPILGWLGASVAALAFASLTPGVTPDLQQARVRRGESLEGAADCMAHPEQGATTKHVLSPVSAREPSTVFELWREHVCK